MLLLTNLLKKYADTTILTIPNFALGNGIYWLKGANGSGKSTLLKMIAGLIPFNGEIQYHNISLKKQSVAYKQQLSYSAADAALPAFLTGLELIEFYAAVRKVSQQEIETMVDLFALKKYVHTTIGTYSSGMQKKLALALAFIGTPKLIMLDEPLSTLDVETATLLSTIIATYHAQGTDFIITSHQDFEYKNIQFTSELLIANQIITIL
jgi:ABC-2 type transport system ATP-binding protein